MAREYGDSKGGSPERAASFAVLMVRPAAHVWALAASVPGVIAGFVPDVRIMADDAGAYANWLL